MLLFCCFLCVWLCVAWGSLFARWGALQQFLAWPLLRMSRCGGCCDEHDPGKDDENTYHSLLNEVACRRGFRCARSRGTRVVRQQHGVENLRLLVLEFCAP